MQNHFKWVSVWSRRTMTIFVKKNKSKKWIQDTVFLSEINFEHLRNVWVSKSNFGCDAPAWVLWCGAVAASSMYGPDVFLAELLTKCQAVWALWLNNNIEVLTQILDGIEALTLAGPHQAVWVTTIVLWLYVWFGILLENNPPSPATIILPQQSWCREASLTSWCWHHH